MSLIDNATAERDAYEAMKIAAQHLAKTQRENEAAKLAYHAALTKLNAIIAPVE